MSVAHEREARKNIALTLGLDNETVSRLSTEFLLSAITSSEGKEKWTQAGHEPFSSTTPAIPASRRISEPASSLRQGLEKRSSWLPSYEEGSASPGSPIMSSIASPSTSRKRSITTIKVTSPFDDGFDKDEMSQTVQTDEIDGDSNREEEPTRRRSRLPSVFALKLGPDLASAILGESAMGMFSTFEGPSLSRRGTLSEHRHREAAGRRNINFAKSLMQHLQRQQARDDFGASKIAADAQELLTMRQLRSSHWFANLYLLKFQMTLWESCSGERAKRMLIKALSPLIIRSVLRRRRNLQTAKLLPSKEIEDRPTVQWLMKSSQIVGKWPLDAVEKLRGKLRPVAFVEGSCIAYGDEPPHRCSVVFVTSGHAVEIPNRVDVLRASGSGNRQQASATASPSPPQSPSSNFHRRSSVQSSATHRQLASDILPLLFDATQQSLLSRHSFVSPTRSSSPSHNNGDEPANGNSPLHSHALAHENHSRNAATYLSEEQMTSMTPQTIQLYQELQHVTPGYCVGDVQIVLGQSRRRTLRAWRNTCGYMITAEAMHQLMLEHLPPSSRADCLHAAKGIAKGQLAKQSKPTIHQLRGMHAMLSIWPLQVLTHLQTLLQPQVNVSGEVVARDLLNCAKICIPHCGLLQVEARGLEAMHRVGSAGGYSRTTVSDGAGPPLAAAQSTPQAYRVVQQVGIQHLALGLGGIAQPDLPLSTCEEWTLRSLSFCETWVAPTTEVKKLLLQYKCIAPTVSIATDLVTAQFSAASLAFTSGVPPVASGAVGATRQQFSHPSVMKSATLSLRLYPAFQNVQDRALLRFAKSLRPRVTSPGEGLCTQTTVPREGFLVYCGTVVIQRTDTTNGGVSTKVVHELPPGSCLAFMETVVEMPATYTASCVNSCILLCGDRQTLLEAVSNGGRDFSSMYALIERCEVLSGKAAKAGDDSAKKHVRHDSLVEMSREKRFEAARDIAATRSKAYAAKMAQLEEDSAARNPHRRPLNVSAQERVDSYRAAQRAFHQMTIENRVFASMGNQLYQYIKHPEVEERLAYLADPLRIHQPVRSGHGDDDSSNVRISAIPRLFATVDNKGTIVLVHGSSQREPIQAPQLEAIHVAHPPPPPVSQKSIYTRNSSQSLFPPTGSSSGGSPIALMGANELIKSLGGLSPLSRDPTLVEPAVSTLPTPSQMPLVSPARSHRALMLPPPQMHSVTASPSETGIRAHPPVPQADNAKRGDYHSKAVRDRVDRILYRPPPPPVESSHARHQDDDGAVTEETVSPKALSMRTVGGMSNFTSMATTKDTPRWSEFRVQSTDLPEVRHWLSPDGSEGFRQHHQRDTLPSSLRQSSAQHSIRQEARAAPHHTMVRIRADDDVNFLKRTLQPRQAMPGGELPAGAHSARCATIRKDITEKLALLSIDDFDGDRTRLMVTHAQRHPDPNLPEPQASMKPVKVHAAPGRHGIATIGTTIQYVVDPFRDGRVHPSAGLREDGQHRVGRVLPRALLQGTKNGIDALSKDERVQLVEKAFQVTSKH